ncbi:uncharacterized protein [Anabrus simplex]|uniref:uncharacterized protein n=1 Tax=Anabrus simplex TaxID=316456 RepID=UPI0035A35617
MSGTTSGRDFVLEVIESYRNHPCLWQVTHADYHDKVKRNNAVDQLVQLFKTKDPEANRETVLKKLSSMRGSYNKELRKIKASQTTGTEPSSVHVPKLWYYDQLSFLKDQDIPRRSHSVTSVLDDMPFGEGESNDGDSADNDDHMSTGSQCSASSRSSRSFKRPLPRVDQVLEKISKRMDQPVTIPTPTEKTRQPHDAFGEYVAEKMRSISASMTPFCQKLINDAIFNAEMGMLNATSRIVTDEGRLPASSSGSQDPIMRAYFDAVEPYP